MANMPRPFLNYSIAELQSEYKRATKKRAFETLGELEFELSHRKTTKARELLVNVRASLKSSSKNVQTSFAFPIIDQTTPTSKKLNSDSGIAKLSRKNPARASVKKPTFKPTQEQQIAIDAFLSGGSMKINAYAGTGKTSTLQLLAHASSARGQYLAFNKSIVKEAKEKFPDNVICSTIHGLALKGISKDYRTGKKKCFGIVNANQLCQLIGIKKIF